MVAMADLPEILVPIRIELDLEGSILKDTFTWNLNGIILLKILISFFRATHHSRKVLGNLMY